MSVWSGWQADLLSHSGAPNTAANRKFLTDWHSHAETNCRNNPVDLSAPAGTGTDCHALPGKADKAQNYPTTGDAVHAFDVQINSGHYVYLRSALESQDPYGLTGTNVQPIVDDLTRWGSPKFARAFDREQAPPTVLGNDAAVLHGWSDFQRSINRHMPAALHSSQQSRRAALRVLSHASKVRL